MNWIEWLAIGFVIGLNCGVALMALMQLSNRRRREKLLKASGLASALQVRSSTF